MSAYAALISLKNTLDHHIHHSCRLSLVGSSLQLIQVVYEELQPWETILQRLDKTSKGKSRNKVNAVDGGIRDTIWNFEDLLESLLSHQIILQSGEAEVERERDVLKLFSIDLQSLQDDADSFIQTLKLMEKEYIHEVDNMPEDEDEEESCISSSPTTTTGEAKSKMIGFSDEFEYAKSVLLLTDEYFARYELFGMAGIGKTRLAREIFEDPEMTTYFDRRLWIRVGRKPSPRLNQDLRSSLAELNRNDKCLIVLDDLWEEELLDSLMASITEMANWSTTRILLTTRDRSVIGYFNRVMLIRSSVMRFLNEEESKELLCLKVFGENIICPYQLDKAATKIANKCEGLPLTILTVAELLSKSDNRDDPKYWEDVAEERNSVFKDAYTEISKVLFPSYDYLPQRLKMLFLYLGVFPRDYEIPKSKIIDMLTAEGWFLDPDKRQHYSPKESVFICLNELCTSRNLVLFKQKSNTQFIGVLDRIKTCRLHSAWRHLFRGEARENKFYHVSNRLVDASEESMRGQRCLCLENNLLFGIKEFCDSVKSSNCASSTRSLLFFGPYHQYPTPIGVDFMLLRELNALQLRFYTFPTQVLKLVQLKYLALTCNGDLPSTISKLFNLKVLIIHPHMSIIRFCDNAAPPPSSSSYVPTEIWNMPELEHIEILGKSFPPPPIDHDSFLEKVSTLVGVGVNASSIPSISKRIPNIQKLVVQMELTPYDDHDVEHSSDAILSSFPHISTLEGLVTLKCSIKNPVQVRSGSFSSWASRSLMLPSELKRLHLSGMGFPWKYIDVIGSLPSLEVLKLRSYAFRGPKWEAREGSFENLEYLLIEDSDLVQWIPHKSFGRLQFLTMKHCYKMEELYWPNNYVNTKIELVSCNPIAVARAKEIAEKRNESYGSALSVAATDDFEA